MNCSSADSFLSRPTSGTDAGLGLFHHGDVRQVSGRRGNGVVVGFTRIRAEVCVTNGRAAGGSVSELYDDAVERCGLPGLPARFEGVVRVHCLLDGVPLRARCRLLLNGR